MKIPFQSTVFHLGLLSVCTVMSANLHFQKLDAVVRSEMQDYGIGGIALALTDGQQLVYAAGYGEAHRDSVFRAGSVSKLFNAIAVMQLVEMGKLDLDVAFARLPGAVLPANPFLETSDITLRQLLSHRSGLQREAPVGGYFDDSQPTLAATCASVRGCAVVTPPNAKTRYSNIGPSLAGQVVATVSGELFEKFQQQHILAPLGMTHSAWLLRDVPEGKVLTSHLRVADGKGGFTHETTPLFDLGTLPAGNLYTTAPDLAQFIMMLDAGGKGPDGPVLKAESLQQMTEPQLDPKGGFGLGFALGKFRTHATIGHNGSVYGHSTALLYLPDSGLGVVVLGNEDIVSACMSRIANTALDVLLEVKTGEKPPSLAEYAVQERELAECLGNWESRSFWAELKMQESRLVGNFASQPCTLTPTAKDAFLLNSRIHDQVPVTFLRKDAGRIISFTAGTQKFTRVADQPTKIPDEWRRFLGSYGPRYIPLVVHEKFGRLYVTTENMVDYHLAPLNRNVFSLPPGMYDDEHAVFLTDKDGLVHSVNFANMILPRLHP